jgi:hypothetical protein
MLVVLVLIGYQSLPIDPVPPQLLRERWPRLETSLNAVLRLAFGRDQEPSITAGSR